MWRGPEWSGVIGGRGHRPPNPHQYQAQPQNVFSTHSSFIESWKNCPEWAPETAGYKPFSEWKLEVEVWSRGCGLQESQLGPNVYRALKGAAEQKIKEIIRLHGPDFLNVTRESAETRGLHDMRDPDTGVWWNGMDYILHVLGKVWGVEQQGQNIKYLQDFFNLRWHNGEYLDNFLQRADLVYQRANTQCGLEINAQGRAWMLSKQLYLTSVDLLDLLKDFGDFFPVTDEELRTFVSAIKRRFRIVKSNLMTPTFLAHQGPQGPGITVPSGPITKSFVIDGEIIADDPYVVAERLQHELAYVQQFISESMQQAGHQAPAGYGESETQNAWYGNENDDEYDESEGEDESTASEDQQSDLSSQSGLGPEVSRPITKEENDAAESAYLAYKTAHRKFRRFMPKGHRSGYKRKNAGKKRRHRKGKGKGKDDNKGKSFKRKRVTRRHYFNKSSKRRKTNPLGPDKKPLKCSICGSIHHFRAECPDKQDQPSGSGGPGNSRPHGPGTFGKKARAHLAEETENAEAVSWERTQMGYHFTKVETPTPNVTRDGDMVWHVKESWHDVEKEDKVNVMFGRSDRIQKCEALLLDTGAYKNLVGDAWVARLDKLNAEAGLKPSGRNQLMKPLTLGGVGKDTQQADKEVVIPISVDGEKAVFQATLVENSDLPALLGLNTIERMNGIIDTRTKTLILPKSRDDVKISCKPGTKELQLVQAPGGYLMLPCSPGSETENLIKGNGSWLAETTEANEGDSKP